MTGNQLNAEAERGFSMVELVALMAAMAVVVMISIPLLHGYLSNRKLKSAARELMGDIAICKARAIAENRHYRISFCNIGTEHCSYTISSDPSASLPAFTQTKTPASFGAGVTLFARTIECDNTDNTSLTFQPRGTVSPDTVCLNNEEGSIARIVTNFTGRARAQFDMR